MEVPQIGSRAQGNQWRESMDAACRQIERGKSQVASLDAFEAINQTAGISAIGANGSMESDDEAGAT